MKLEREEGEIESGPGMISPAFRNGSVTVVGVVTAFSLGFLTAWGTAPSPWTLRDLIAVTPIGAGVVLQLWSLAAMLSVRSLELAYYNRAIRVFLVGLVVVSLGVGVALVASVQMVSDAHHVIHTPD